MANGLDVATVQPMVISISKYCLKWLRTSKRSKLKETEYFVEFKKFVRTIFFFIKYNENGEAGQV